MVDAAVLEDYEIWFALASILVSAMVGFLVAYIQSYHELINVGTTIVARRGGDDVYLVVAVVFGILFLLAGGRALVLRGRIKKKSTTYAMQATGQEPSKR